MLKPIWTTKPPTAGNIRGRIDKILGWATAMGYRTGDNPASRDGPLMHLLPSLNKLQRAQKHHAAVPYKDVPAVVADLGQLGSVSARALLGSLPWETNGNNRHLFPASGSRHYRTWP